MRAYVSILKVRFSVQLQYRAAAAAGFFTQFFFGLVRVMVFIAFYASSARTQPMSLVQAVTYSWLVQVERGYRNHQHGPVRRGRV
jgi:ABC-2 type transport system permease protein